MDLKGVFRSGLKGASAILKLCLKVMLSIGKGLEIFREYSHLFDFHLKALCMHSYVHDNFSPEMC